MASRTLFRTASRLVLHPWFRLNRGMTLGVRCLVIDERGRVLLVRHSYAPGWHLPGGGVERGETVYDAVLREIREEGGITAEEAPRLHGIFSNEESFAGDHLACFVLRRFRQEAWHPSREIRAVEFYESTKVPEDTTGGTCRRISEVFSETPAATRW